MHGGTDGFGTGRPVAGFSALHPRANIPGTHRTRGRSSSDFGFVAQHDTATDFFGFTQHDSGSANASDFVAVEQQQVEVR